MACCSMMRMVGIIIIMASFLNVVASAQFESSSSCLCIRCGGGNNGLSLSSMMRGKRPNMEEVITPTPPPPPKSQNPKLKDATERTLSAAVLLAAMALLVKFTGERGLYVLIVLLQATMYAETTSIIEAFYVQRSKNGEEWDLQQVWEKWWWFATILTGTSLRTILRSTFEISEPQMDLLWYGMMSVGLLGAVLGMATHGRAGPESFRRYLGKVAGSHFALVFIVGQSSFWIKTIQSFGIEWVLYPALLVIINDTMAYIFGVLVGKHALLRRLSPKKTVEGFAGAGVSTILVSIPLLKLLVWNRHSISDKAKSVFFSGNDNGVMQHALVLAAYISLIAPFGGFLASAVKRAHGAKDFGQLIPGHGGVVDRFDCHVVTAPFVYLYLKQTLEH